MSLRLSFVAALIALIPSLSEAAPKKFGPFTVDEAMPGVIELDGDIELGSALNFRRALAATPNPELLVLDSGGGLVDMGLLIADDVYQRGMSTLIPAGAECFSACSFVFLAGAERIAQGSLGVHQISSGLPDLERAQMSISDIIDVLNRFDTPTEVLTIMFRTPADEMHVFTPAEVAAFRLNRSAPIDEAAPVPPPASSLADLAPLSLDNTEPTQAPPEASATVSAESMAAISALESYARRPTRVALYEGLDFFGEDLASYRHGSAPACAAACLDTAGCKAFTFNVDERVAQGPNCFLKSGRGQVDGNVTALSGLLLTRAERDPEPIVIGTIDPTTNLFDDVDLPGFDLSQRAHPGAATAQQCRLACVRNDQCLAFTYVTAKRECWLKRALTDPQFLPGAVTGLKEERSFSPVSIIDLQ